jgi:AraC-like DNA-binding protein
MLTISENILAFISGFGILQGFLLSGLLYFHPKSDKSVNLFLSLYIFFISSVMTMPFTINLIGWKNSYFIQPLPLLPGIFLYFYIRSFKETITWKKVLPHLTPVFIFFFLTYVNLAAMSKIYPDAKEIPVDGLKRPLTLFIMLSRALQQLIYYFLARKELNSYQRSIHQLYSETSRIDLHWARFLINGYIVLISSFLVIFPLMLRFPAYFNSLLLVNMAIATPYIYMAAYKGFTQHTIWQVRPQTNKQAVEEEIHIAEKIETENNHTSKQKIEKTGIHDEKVTDLIQRIIHLMEQDRLYQETELTLQQLAAKLNVPAYQVSVTLNEGMNKSFYELVNGYRVQEAKRLLLDANNRNYTILSVGFEAGFNSKTTFNTVFKKFTGLTPTEFRQREKQTYQPV